MVDAASAVLDGTTASLVGVRPAGEVVPEVGRRRYLHSGPPIGLDELPGPMRGALLGALVFEGEAPDLDVAARIVDSGEVEIRSCHSVGGVGAMAGIVTPQMPVVVVQADSGRLAFSPVNEGLGRALRFGSNQSDIIDRLRWLRDLVAPLLDRAIGSGPVINLTELQAEGLRRGDECHNRNVASTTALLIRLAPNLVRVAKKTEDAAYVLEQAAENPHFFLPFSMAAAKAVADSADGVPGSPIVTAMAANGRRFGIRVSGLAGCWFCAPSPVGNPRLFKGYRLEDVQPTMGDSFITETIGLGAFALTAAPAISSFIGGDAAKRHDVVASMRSICSATSSRFLVPEDDFQGTPVGIDVTRVARTGVAPAVNNGLAHREAGRGQVGAGLTYLPIEPFLEAAAVLAGGTESR